MTLEDYVNKALFGLVGLAVVGMIWVTQGVLQSVTKSEVEEMIKRVAESSPYLIDKHSIHKSIEELYLLNNNQDLKIEKNKDTITGQNEKIWETMQALRIEIERLHIRQEVQDEEAKKKTKKKINKGERGLRVPVSRPF